MTKLSSSDGLGNYRDAEGTKVVRPVRLQVSTEESKQRQEVAIENRQIFRSGDSPNLAVSMRDIDQIDTQNNLNAISQGSFFHSGMMNGLPIDEAITLRIPAIPISSGSRVANPEMQNVEAEGYISHLRKLIKSLGVYSLSSLASPLASLVLAPFLTRNLSHADYGALAVLNTVIALFTGVTQLGLSTAFFRSYNYDYESQKDRLGVLSTTIVLLSLISIFTAIATVIAAPWLTMFLFNDSSLINAVRLMGVVVLLQNLTIPGFAWLRAESRAMFFSTLSITNLLVCVVANFILVGVLQMGITGSLIATGSSYAVVVIYTLPIMLLRAGFRPRVDIARGLLSFGLPSVFTFLSVWVLQLSDRFLLVRLGSLVQTASYAVAYSLGGVLSTVVLSPFTLAWPSTMYSIAKRDAAADIFRLVFRWYSIILLFAAFGLSLMSTIVLELFFPPSYQSAAPIIPIITMSIMFYGVYIIFMTGTSIRRKTWYAVAFTTTAALANVGLNIILIPFYGSMGAAIATLVAYILLALVGYVVNQRIYPLPFEIGIFVIGLLIGIALYIGSGFLARNEGTYEGWGIYMGALALYAGSLVFLGMLSTRIQKNKSIGEKKIIRRSNIVIASNIWSKIFIREGMYASFFPFVRTMILLLLAAGSGLLLSSIMSKVLPVVGKIGIEPGTVPLIFLVMLVSALIMAFILLLRLQELAATAVIAVNIVIDLYLALYFVSLLMALALLLTFFLARSPRYPWVEPPALWLWVLFLVLAIFPTTQTIAPLDGITYYLQVFLGAFIVFWLGTIIARDITNVRYLFRWLSVFGAFVAIITIIQAITGLMLFGTTRYQALLQSVSYYHLGTSSVSRAGAFLVNPDPNACFLAMMLLIVLGLLVEEPSLLIKAFYLILTLLIALAMLFTYSTEGALGALAGIIALIALAGSTRYRNFLLLLIFGFAIVVIVCFPAQVDLLLQHASNPSELQLRSGIWQTAIRVIEAFPLTGVGLGSYVYRVRAEPYRVPAQYIVEDHPHNSYLEFAALAGLPVLIMFVTLLVLALSLALRNWMQADIPSRPLLGAGVAVVIVLSFVSLSDAAWTFPPVAALGWLVLGVISSPLLTKSRKSQAA